MSGKGGKGLSAGSFVKRVTKRLYCPPQTPIEEFTTLSDHHQQVPKKKKLNNDDDDDNHHLKRNDHHPWLHTIILRNVFEYLKFRDQLRFRLVNSGMNEELGLNNNGDDQAESDSSSEENKYVCPWYGFQMMLKFERFCRELKSEESSVLRSRKILYTLNGCLLGVQAEIRNAQICSHQSPSLKNPFVNYFRDGEDVNFKKLAENDQYVELFRSGIVKYTEWVGCTMRFSEGSSCELKIKRKSNNSFVYLQQVHAVGVNGREGTNDESYYLGMREDDVGSTDNNSGSSSKHSSSSRRKPLVECSFYRDSNDQGEGYIKRRKIMKLMKSCEIPHDWTIDQFLTFLMLCANCFFIRMDGYSSANFLERIKASDTNDAQEEDKDDKDDLNEEKVNDDDDDCSEESSDDDESTMGLFSNEGNERDLENERKGKSFMNDLLSKACHHNKTVNQSHYDLLCLNRVVLRLCAKSNFDLSEISEDYTEYEDVIKSKIVKIRQQVGFFITIGEYVSQRSSSAKVTLRGVGESTTFTISLYDINGFHSRSTNFNIEKGDAVVVVEFIQDDDHRIANVDPDFKILVLGKEMASEIEDDLFIALLGVTLGKNHKFLLCDEKMVTCMDSDAFIPNPFVDLFELY